MNFTVQTRKFHPVIPHFFLPLIAIHFLYKFRTPPFLIPAIKPYPSPKSSLLLLVLPFVFLATKPESSSKRYLFYPYSSSRTFSYGLPFDMRSAGSPAPSPAGRPRRRPDLTLPLPQRDPSLAVPLPLPPPSATSSATPPNISGQLLLTPNLSDFDRVRRVGIGSGGTVYMVRHRPTGKIYAMKVIYGNHEDAVRRQIHREIEILRTADNPFVVRCHGMYDHAGEIQILLEYMDGGSLERHRISSERSLADAARQILSGLAYLHRRKIVHRDIKPSNLLINAAREVKIADFGVGRILARTMDPCNSSVGTIAYMSPERINTDLNHGNYDGCAGDIWSFGISVLEFYLGRFPFGENIGRQGDWASLMCAICYSNPPEAPASASRELRSFIACCLQKDPGRRLSAVQLLQHPFIAQQSPPPPPPSSSSASSCSSANPRG